MKRFETSNPRRGGSAPRGFARRGSSGSAFTFVAALLCGCTIVSLRQAPIEDRSSRPAQPTVATTNVDATASATVAMPASPTLARDAPDGVYIVRRGDTLYSIALFFGQDYRDLARWNNIDDPSRLRIGQGVRVIAPETIAAPVATAAANEVRPLAAPTPIPAPASAPASPGSSGGTSATTASRPASAAGAPANAPTSTAPDGGLTWMWPAAGKVVGTFQEPRNKGIDLDGADGDPVLAAGDGAIVYAGNGLRGFGNLLIVKHSDDFISAYAHNRRLLVKQGQSVKRGQRIAELGKSDAETPGLHFEIRRRGQPVDPLKYLPAR